MSGSPLIGSHRSKVIWQWSPGSLRFGQNLPDGSYGKRNRQAIATREARVATRLRAIERAYRLTAEHDTATEPPGPARACHPVQHAADWEMELE
jgi:hypothetical protein